EIVQRIHRAPTVHERVDARCARVESQGGEFLVELELGFYVASEFREGIEHSLPDVAPQLGDRRRVTDLTRKAACNFVDFLFLNGDRLIKDNGLLPQLPRVQLRDSRQYCFRRGGGIGRRARRRYLFLQLSPGVDKLLELSLLLLVFILLGEGYDAGELARR